MTDYRHVIDDKLVEHFKGNPDVRVETMHDDYAIVYLKGLEYSHGYCEELDVDAFIAKLEKELADIKSKVLYREHRGELHDSLRTTIRVSTKQELREHILKVDEWAPKAGKLTITKYGNGIDERINWDTHIVMWNHTVLGFTDGPLD